LFFAKDIKILARTAGLEIKSIESHDALAWLLGDCFLQAFGWAARDATTASRSETIKWAKGVRTTAHQLLSRLDMPGEVSAYESLSRDDISGRDWYQNLDSGFFGYPHFPFPTNADYVRAIAIAPGAESKRKGRRRAGAEGSTAAFDDQAAAVGFARLLLAFAPVCLAIVKELASREEQEAYSRPAKRGNRPDTFRLLLFQRLARMHEIMFGISPIPRIRSIRSPDEKRDGPATRWVSRIIRVAAERVEQCFPQHDRSANAPRSAVQAVRDLDSLSLETKGRYLEEGWTHWQQAERRRTMGIRHATTNSRASMDR
jgi:hypothetical protein